MAEISAHHPGIGAHLGPETVLTFDRDPCSPCSGAVTRAPRPSRCVFALDMKTGDAWGIGFQLALFKKVPAGKERILPILRRIEAPLLG